MKSKIDILNGSYETVVGVAAEKGKVEILRELLEGGAAVR